MQRNWKNFTSEADTAAAITPVISDLTETENKITENLEKLEEVLVSNLSLFQKKELFDTYLSAAKSHVKMLGRLFQALEMPSRTGTLASAEAFDPSEEACYSCLRSYASMRSHPEVVRFLDLMMSQLAPAPVCVEE